MCYVYLHGLLVSVLFWKIGICESFRHVGCVTEFEPLSSGFSQLVYPPESEMDYDGFRRGFTLNGLTERRQSPDRDKREEEAF